MGVCSTSNCKCKCTGKEVSTLPITFSSIRKCTSDLYMYGFVGDMELDETWITSSGMGPPSIVTQTPLSKAEWSKKVRSWVKEAADYHGIPQILLAIILQHENGQNAPKWKRLGQAKEREIQAALASLEEGLNVKFPGVLGKAAGGSTGLCNMSRATFRMGAKYIEDNYCKPVIPDKHRYSTQKIINIAPFYSKETINKIDIKTNHAGLSIHCDLYHCAAHLRQLIDEKTGKACHSKELSREECKDVIAGYNGKGDLALKYGNDGLKYLDDASCGQKVLFFYG